MIAERLIGHRRAVSICEESMKRIIAALVLFSLLNGSLLVNNLVRGECGPGGTVVKIEPASVTVGSRGNKCVGDQFMLAVKVYNVPTGGWALYGLEVRLYWNVTYLEYVSHLVKAPVEHYADGVLREPIFIVKDEVNATAGTYWLAMATLSGQGTSGDGTIFEIIFAVKLQPIEPPAAITLPVKFDSFLAPSYACPLVHGREFGNVTICALASPDVNRDGVVDIHDIVAVGSRYGCREGDVDWSQNADIAPGWGIIDIFDCVTCAYHYGKQSPYL